MRLNYLLFPPAGEAQQSYPLIIFLHGSGERGTDLELVKKWGLPKFVDAGEVALPAYIAAPQCPEDVRWSNVTDALDALLDELLAKHPIDADRVLLTGFSMGGAGTWAWALKRPQHFAALMPVSGGFHHPDDQYGDIDPTVLKDTPLWIAHGAADMTVSVQWSDELCASLLTHRADFGYTRYPDVDHGETSDRVFRDLTMLHWLLAQKR